ncbi:hypothetical protein C1H46_014923 [Malus baccata]|uniref:Hydroxyproline-rich glycoprotein family protein n=1 Tax=Malus baccata TaxID=106549 RepID=A0A540MM34_MALBA|nr:hypothetical protein C1H46_014923 [Malus baccata]
MNSSVDTISAAATAIVSAEARAQPTTVSFRDYGVSVEKSSREEYLLPILTALLSCCHCYGGTGIAINPKTKRRWRSCWSQYWCFGSHKTSKRIGHAVLVPEPVVPGAAVSTSNNQTTSTAIVLPFIAPPSSPASFLPSDPPSASQSPAGFLSLASLSANAYSSGEPASMFSIGPYAYETQLVSPPVFSTFNTEPSTAPFTPPPESVQLTTPSSPEVPFAQLLSSSLDRQRRNSSNNQKFPLSQYEYQPYQQYPGSPGGNLISPGSAISNSGTSSPFPDRHPMLEFRMGEDGAGLGSRLGSGTLTPDGYELGSRLGSGCLTPNGVGVGSGTGSGCLTPDGTRPASSDGFHTENQISEVASLANTESGCHNGGTILFDHRVSFELTGEDVACCLANKALRTATEYSNDIAAENSIETDTLLTDSNNQRAFNVEESLSRIPENASGEGEDQGYRKQRSITLGSTKEFNFDYTKAEVPSKSNIGSEWWANKNVAAKESKPCNDWTFFPILQPGVR